MASDTKDSDDTTKDAAPEPPKISAKGMAAMQGDEGDSQDQTESVVQVPENQEINFKDLQPNTTYEKNGYTYQTDEMGRTISAEGQLKLKPGERSHQQTEIGHLGRSTDEGGHLIATRFDGPKDGFNIVPQDADLNRSARSEWKEMENEWAQVLKAGEVVDVKIEPYYDDETKRPAMFDVFYKMGGKSYTKTFLNE